MDNGAMSLSNQSIIQKYGNVTSEKIEEYIKVVEKHMEKCEKEGKFLEANKAKNKLKELTIAKDKRRLIEAKEKHQEEKKELQSVKKDELGKFNSEMDKQFYEMNEKFQEMQKALEEEHQKELNELHQKFDEKYKDLKKKDSPDILNLQKSMEIYAKKKDYLNAHKMQMEIAEKQKKNQEAFENYKLKTIEKELENLQKKHDIEKKGLELKIQSYYNNFLKERALKVQEMIQNHKNTLRNLDNKQKAEETVLECIANEAKTGMKQTIRAKGEYSNKVRKINTAATQKYLEQQARKNNDGAEDEFEVVNDNNIGEI